MMFSSAFKSKIKETKFQMQLLLASTAAGTSLLLTYMIIKRPSKRKHAGSAVLNAEYAGYKEKVSDYPNRTGSSSKSDT